MLALFVATFVFIKSQAYNSEYCLLAKSNVNLLNLGWGATKSISKVKCNKFEENFSEGMQCSFLMEFLKHESSMSLHSA